MTTKTPFIVYCGECKHEWPAFYSHILLEDAAAIGLSLRCPMCAVGGDKIFCGPTPVDEINTSSKRKKNNER